VRKKKKKNGGGGAACAIGGDFLIVRFHPNSQLVACHLS